MQVMSSSVQAISPPLSQEIHGPTYCSPSVLYLRPPKSIFERPSPSPESPRVDPGGTSSQAQASLLLKPDQRSPKKLAICGFHPLPSIVASPISTPTVSISPKDSVHPLYPLAVPIASSSSARVLFPSSTPTWIATPPTPPAKSIRRSSTISARRSPFTVVPPSASFPASMHPHGGPIFSHNLKRSASVPTFSLRSREASSSFPTSMRPHIVQSTQLNINLAASNDNPFDVTFSIHIGDDGPAPARRGRERSGTYVSPIFHIDKERASLEKEDDGSVFDKDILPSPEEVSPAGSWSDHSVEDIWETESNKDAFRKFHALKELLATEVGYLMDLKALVTVYLRNLPTLAARSLASSTTFGRASSSFTSGPWMYSYTQLQAAALASTSTLPDTQNASSTAPTPVKESKSRYIFSDSELESLTRNAEEILQLHEHFVRELRDLLEPLGFEMQMAEDDHGHLHLHNLGVAIRAVSTKFATEASRFNAYQSFCAGHAEAVDIIRKAYQQFPFELDAFESRCSTMVSEMLEEGTKPPASEPRPASSRSSAGSRERQSQNLNVEDRKRAMSLTSLDGAVRSLRPRASMIIAKDSVAFPSEPRREKSAPRIAFKDYLIKPIQRICKYPLLLDQLLPSKALRMLSQNAPDVRLAVDVVVESAAQAMRHVATSVDEARHRQDVATQSTLIFSRICIPTNVQTSSSPSVRHLTSEFLASLGDCLLSGSLDVIHYDPYRPLGQNSSIKVKYLGAFLYPGGYLLLVKVSKGKKYEPKHWFSLVDFEVADVEDDGAMLPCSFKLSSGDKHFELAAACQREKDAWLTSIHEALEHVPSWTNEPTPSFRFDEKGELLPEVEESRAFEVSACLSPIRSIPETGHASDTESTEPFFASLRGGKAKRKKLGYEPSLITNKDAPPPPSRRSSSTSVKAIFSPMTSDTETVVIRRSSHAARVYVDQELQDIISQSCLTARSYAFSREEELFQAPKTTRSNSGIGMAGMARLSKHESVRVPRRRTTESLDSLKGNSPLSATSLNSRRKEANKLNITSIEYESLAVSTQELSPSPSPSPPSSHPSSSRDRVSSLCAQASESTLVPPSKEASNADAQQHKPRSFVRNVRGLFHLRPVSPISVIVSHPSQNLVHASEPHSASYNVIHRWAHQSLRRRARSVHDEPVHHEPMFDEPEKQYPMTAATTRASTPLST